MRNLLFISLLLFGCTTEDNHSAVRLENREQTIEAKVVQKNTEIIEPIQVKVMSSEYTEFDTVRAIINDRHYTLYPYGKIAVRWTQTSKTDTFQLNTELIIKEAYFLEYKNDLIIYYVASDLESGASYIECYDVRTNKLKWKNDIRGFNLTTPVILNNMTYMASIDFIGKLNLDNGKYLWRHDGLYEKTRFHSFRSIEIDEFKVNFIGSLSLPFKDTRKSGRIIVNDNTGEIEKIIKNPSL